MPLIDLTHPIKSGMQVFPGDPNVQLQHALSLATDGVAVMGIHMGSHTGTHLDAPSHSIEGGRTTSEVLLDELVGEAAVVHLMGIAAGEEILWDQIEGQVDEEIPPIVVLATGWDRHFGTAAYLDHPVLALQAAEELWKRGMRLLAVDTLNPDRTIQSTETMAFPVHQFVLGSGGLIIENVRGASNLPARCRTGFFPLKLDQADGAPVRAVAWVD
ncbi:cyclase family protein [Pseudarthrobacter sp. NamE5]|uniref:cyclase family protein n=1 Tax=Pseudarthrobacter sp. NamE5 TaxID=2576839 RepID=UPI00110BFE80|nr:cyclase family protein [Pseudarthrobacter sp. NamE5]TLM83500.1 cyclase family protein [Pseudarthrobacter sp. NamE5]